MFTKFFRRIKEGRVVTETASVANAVASMTTVTAQKPTEGFLYAVTLPGQEPVMLRAKNQVEVKQFVRDAHGLTRLPAGTTVERMD